MPALGIIIAQRLWQAGAGLVTLVLVTRFLTPALQGWYYSFLSIGALYTIFDLGLSVVLTQTAAHLFVGVTWRPHGNVEGPETSRLHALVHRAARSYLGLASAFAVLVLAFGLVFFSTASAPVANWQMPWIVLVLSLAAGLVTLPFLAIVEGSGAIGEVYTVRLAQGVAGAALCWLALLLGAGLWASAAIPFAAAVVQPLWLFLRRPVLVTLALARPTTPFSWRLEIWPLQWRLGLSWLAGYMVTQVYTPLLFATHGPVVAGQMGLSLTAANMLGLVAFSAVTRNVPAMAQAAARSRWTDMDTLFSRGLGLSSAAYIVGALAILSGLTWPFLSSFAARFLPLSVCALLFAAIFLNQIYGALAAHLRSYRREPLVWLAVGSAGLTAAGAEVAVGPYSAAGIITVLFLVQAIVVLPLSIVLWRRFHRNWRRAR